MCRGVADTVMRDGVGGGGRQRHWQTAGWHEPGMCQKLQAATSGQCPFLGDGFTGRCMSSIRSRLSGLRCRKHSKWNVLTRSNWDKSRSVPVSKPMMLGRWARGTGCHISCGQGSLHHGQRGHTRWVSIVPSGRSGAPGWKVEWGWA